MNRKKIVVITSILASYIFLFIIMRKIGRFNKSINEG
ncbi:hypothetical protein SAMN04487934_11338 [Eubacterium ruminantium]|nr:hypothetical protein SAMN04487934_11338 [Eubacterium ruminantium]